MTPLRIAIASKEGLAVSEHFGHAHLFWIYEFPTADGAPILLEKRDVDHYCHGQSGDASAMVKILATIKDCRAVLVAKIGDGPTEKLRAIGVEAIADYAYEAIEDALQACRNRFADH